MNPMEQKMKQVGRQMSLYMGLVMSACLSVVGVLTGNIGNLAAGRIGVPQLIVSVLISFAISFAISLLIGFLVPIHKVSASVAKNMKPGIGRRCLETLVSDLIYTPVITLAMTAFAYMQVMRASGGKAPLSYGPMFSSSLAICMVVGFILIYIFTPILLKRTMNKYGVSLPPQGPVRKEE